MTSGDAKRRTGNTHTGTLYIARVNAIAKSDVGVTVGADVANGGEASAEREAGVLHAGDSFARNGNAQARVAMAGRIARKMGVDIDQAMLALSTYVGHAKVTDTYWYLTGVPELMAVAMAKFESFMQTPEVPHA